MSVGGVNDRLGRCAVGVGLAALAFSQQPGLVVADTKLDLVVSPGAFLARSLHAWDPLEGFGQLQNQAYGYLFPMGPFFWLGHALGLPAWVIQRGWWVLVLIVAYVGFLKVCDALGVGSSWSRVVGAAAYALGPRALTVLGPISAEALPLALLPWVLLPLIHGSRRGSPRRAAALSGIAIACTGGINAAATLAVLVLPALWLVTRSRGTRRRSLAGWWGLAVLLAVSWWLVPLLVLGRYAFPFLDSIETSGTTTSVTSTTNVLRGADHWVAYLVTDGRPTWSAGWMLAADPWLVAATVAVAVLGLWGLAQAEMPERTFLVVALATGSALVGLGYAGRGGGPLASQVHDLLDGALAAFRNVHKSHPVLRLPLTLGLTWTLAAVPSAARSWAARQRGPDGERLRRRAAVAPAVAVLCSLVLLLSTAAPALAGRLPNDGAFEAVPPWWSQAATAAGAQDGRTLLEPASGFGEYSWGRPWDEPLQALAEQPWAVRNAVPLGAPGLTRLLDAVEQDMTTGRASPDLAPALSRAGIRFVLLRNDLSSAATATPPGVARSALAHSPGIHQVAQFGPLVSPSLGTADGIAGKVATLEVFEVVPAGDGRLTTFGPNVIGFTGGPEAMLTAPPGSEAWVATADGSAAATVVTDTLRRRQLNTGADVTRNYSETLDGSQEDMGGRRIRDIDPFGGADVEQSVVVLSRSAVVRASSTSTDPYLAEFRGSVGGPYAALDGSTATSWIAQAGDASPTWTLDLEDATSVGTVRLDFSGLPSDVASPTSVVVTDDAGAREVPVDGSGVAVTIGTTRSLSIRLVRADGESRVVGMSEVRLGALGLRPSTRVADPPPTSSATSWAFAVGTLSRPGCLEPVSTWVCRDGVARSGDEVAALDRTFRSVEDEAVAVTAQATALAGGDLDLLLDQAAGYAATGSSRRFAEPVARPGAALDGDPATAWWPAVSDAHPTLNVDLGGEKVLSSITVEATRGGPAVAQHGSSTEGAVAGPVVSVVLRGDAGQSREVVLRPVGPTSFPTMATKKLTVALRINQGTTAAGLRISEVGLGGFSPAAPGRLQVPCSQGPTIVVDGDQIPTAIDADARSAAAGAPVAVLPCRQTLDLDAGLHRLRATPSTTFSLTSVTLAPPTPASASVPQASVLTWSAEHRAIDVEAWPEARIVATGEGYNDGWRATLEGGGTLVPIRVDGWRQGWVVPAGASGTVVLDYPPGRLQRAGLLVGAVLLLLLVVGALAPGRRGATSGPAAAASLPFWSLVLVAGVAAVLLGGIWGALAWFIGCVLLRVGGRWWWPLAAVWIVTAGATHLGGWPDALDSTVAVALQVMALCLMVSAVVGAAPAGTGRAPAPGWAPRGATTKEPRPRTTPPA